jgi:Na+/proline symporter
MIACLIAGVTGAETFMVVAAAIFTRNFYIHVVRGRPDRHYLWVGRFASAAMLALAILLASFAGSVNQLYLYSVRVIGLLGASFWLGVTWRRANSAGVWASVLGGLAVWAGLTFAGDHSAPFAVLVTLACQFGVLIVVSLLTTRPSDARLDPFFARLHTPVGRESEVLLVADTATLPESATLGMEGVLLDYDKASRFGYARLRRLGIELPRLRWFDGAGFLAAWGLVAILIWLLHWLARLGA